MTSEIRVNKLQNRVGLGTVEYTNTGIVVSGIVTCTELSGLTALNIAGVGTASTLDINGDIDVDGHTNLDNVSIAGVSTFAGNVVIADSIVHDGDTDTAIRFPAADTIRFEVGNQQAVHVLPASAGSGGARMGLGTNNPTGMLHIYGANPPVRIQNSNDSANLQFGMWDTANIMFQASHRTFKFATETSHPIVFHTGGLNNERLRITSDGKVGINSTSPSAPLEIYTAASAAWKFRIDTTVSDGAGFYQRSNGDFELVLRDASNNVNYIAGTSGALQFATSGTERLRITSGGNILIGKTADSGKPLEVYQAGDAAIRIQNSASGTGSNDGILLEIGSSSKDALIWNYESANMRFGTVGTERLRIDSSGRVLIGGGSSPSQVGDGRLIVYADTRLHPAIKADCIDGGINRANGFTLLADNYQPDESICNFGISYSGAGLVLSRGVKVSNAADDTYLSSMDSFAMKPAVFKLDDSGDFKFLNTDTSATTTTDSAVTLYERLRITSEGNVNIGSSANPGNTLRYLDVYNTNTGSSAGAILRLITTKSDGSSAAGLDIVKYKAGGAYIINNENVGADTGFIAFNTGSSGVSPATHLRVAGNGEVVVSPRNGGASNNRTSIHFNNVAHTPFIAFKSNNLTEAAYIKAGESSGGCDLEFQTKNTSGTLLSRLTLKNNGEIVTHQLAGNDKGYPIIMGTGTVSSNTNMSGSLNMHDINGVHTSGGPNYHIGGWVYLGNDYGPAPYPARRFKIFAPNGFTNGTIVYQVWHDGDSNYYYGGLYEIRINVWTDGDIESVTLRLVNGYREDLRVIAYNDSNGIMIQTSSIWGRVFIRRFGYDDGGRNPGSSHCAVANNGALAIYNSQGTDDGAMPTSGSPVDLYCFDGQSGSAGATHTGGYSIENSAYFDG